VAIRTAASTNTHTRALATLRSTQKPSDPHLPRAATVTVTVTAAMSLLSLRLCARSALRLCPAVGARASTLSTCKFATIPALHIYQRRAIATSRHTATAAAATPAASASAPADAEPINPEEYAARQSAAGRFTEDDDDSFSGEAPYVDGEPDPARAALKRRLLDAALPLVHEHGWSYAALRGGATALGMSTAAIGLATRGPVELVVRAQELAHEHMLEKMTTMPLESAHCTESEAHGDRCDRSRRISVHVNHPSNTSAHARDVSCCDCFVAVDVAVSLSTSEQLENAIRFRLEGIVPYLSHWPAALALLAQPCAAPYSIISAVNAIDEIWHYCGDKSTDVSRHEQTA
jgi:ubiquinone biosynthesis protein COQ9